MEAKKGAARILGCYRTGDANDPESYIAAVVSVLVRHSTWVIREVTEPATGLPSKLKWLPTIAEIREECDRLQAYEKRMELKREQINSQLVQRLQITDQRPKKTYAELVADCNARGLQIGPKAAVPMKDQEITEFRDKHGISQAAWDAIPNAPRREA